MRSRTIDEDIRASSKSTLTTYSTDGSDSFVNMQDLPLTMSRYCRASSIRYVKCDDPVVKVTKGRWVWHSLLHHVRFFSG